MKPYNLPAELPNPPEPPAGHRWRCDGRNFADADFKIRAWLMDGDSSWVSMTDCQARCPGAFYLSAIPLRQPPAGVAAVPDGFEFYDGERTPGGFNYGDVVIHNGSEWVRTTNMGKYAPSLCALRIGSEIHHENMKDAVAESPVAVPKPFTIEAGKRYVRRDGTISNAVQPHAGFGPHSFHANGWCYSLDGSLFTDKVSPEDLVSEYVEPEPAKPEPAKAREWWLTLATEGNMLHKAGNIIGCSENAIGPAWGGCKWEVIHLREILPGESSLLEQAVGHLRNIRIGKHGAEVQANQFLDMHFEYNPAPAPEPEPIQFDITKPETWSRDQQCAVAFIEEFPFIESWAEHAKPFKAEWEAANPPTPSKLP